MDGDSDGVVPATDGKAYAAKFTGPRTHLVVSAGHKRAAGDAAGVCRCGVEARVGNVVWPAGAPDTQEYKPACPGPQPGYVRLRAYAATRMTTSKTSDHILIVDDDREIRELLTTYLVKNGLRVVAVPTGAAHARGAGGVGAVRPDHPRPDAAGRRRAHAVPRPSHRQVQGHAHPHAHRAQRGGRPHPRSGDGRRRLSGQAVFRPRAAGAHALGAAPHAHAAAQHALDRVGLRSWGSASGRWTPRRAT